MKVHLYTTDISALDLLFPASDQIVAVIVPANRARTEKVGKLTTACPHPVFIHNGGVLITDTDGHETLPQAHIGVSWMYTQLFPDDLLLRYPLGILNFHAGEPGPHALLRAIERGDPTLRCFWHRCVAEVDAGEVFKEVTIPLWDHDVGEADRANRDAMIAAGQSMFPQAWAGFNYRRVP